MKLLGSTFFQGISSFRHWSAFFAGVSMVFCFAPFGFSWLAPFLIAVLWSLWEGASPRQASFLGFYFGFGLFGAGTWWLYISLNIFGGVWPPLALFLMFCLIAFMSGYIAFSGWLIVKLSVSNTLLRFLIVAPSVWTLFEWLRGWVLTGFPWLSIGYSQPESFFGNIAPITGVYGVTWLVCFTAGLIITFIKFNLKIRIFSVSLVVLLITFLWLSGQRVWTYSTGEFLRVALVQGAISQEKKWLPENLESTLKNYAALTLQNKNHDLIIWPEVAIPALPFEVKDFLDTMREEMIKNNTQLLTGILDFDISRGQYLNSLWSIGDKEGFYNKRHLVPFGEFFPVPRFLRSWLRLMNLPYQDLAEGQDDQSLLFVKDVPIAAMICYEIAFGSEQLPFLPSAELLVNVSNDAWFGDSFAPHQHLQMGQMRSLETGRYLLRATNTGITAIINPKGKIVRQINQFAPGVLSGNVEPRGGSTPYIIWGNKFVVSLCLIFIFISGLLKRKNFPDVAF
ncbi:MAG: apolipoprotein N-acyltransferase [Pseudomonadota bacterium]|nr:apolipoprotein N-acyltransferase [Pseudomonadota bacterium]